MQVFQVSGDELVEEFHRLPGRIYKNDPKYIPLLRPMVEDIFNPSVNSKFKNGDACRWIVKDKDEYIGRVAAFLDHDYLNGYDQPTGCIGFFECINEKEVAFLLFNTAKKWLKENKMEAMDGPVNFGENFFYWGLLVYGFQRQTFGMQYHPPYYRRLFEDYGFKTFYEQYSYAMDITHPDLPERFWKIAAWVAKKPGYSYEHFSFRKENKFIRDFMQIYELAWSGHTNYKPADFHQLKEMINQARFFLEEEFIWFVYHKGDPIAFFMMIPDLNQIIAKLKSGKLNWINILKFIYYKKMKKITRCRVIVLGVVPKFQHLGIESGIFYRLKKVMLKKPWYKEMEMSWIGDFNPKMNALFKSFGATHTLTHLTMRYLFDQEKEFRRAPIIN